MVSAATNSKRRDRIDGKIKNPHQNPHGHEKNPHAKLRQVTGYHKRKNLKPVAAQAFPAIAHDK